LNAQQRTETAEREDELAQDDHQQAEAIDPDMPTKDADVSAHGEPALPRG
jgi:hypothetical protein